MPTVRLVLTGDSGTGKSSLFSRYHKGEFSRDIGETHGVSYQVTHVKIGVHGGSGSSSSSGGGNVTEAKESLIRLQLWDFAGKYRKFESMKKLLMDNEAHGIFLVMDVTRRSTFESIADRIADLRPQIAADTLLMLSANKTEVFEEEWQVSRKEIWEFATKHNLVHACFKIYCFAY